MANPDSTGFDFKDVSDFQIRELLASENPREQQLGLVYLDAKKRDKICGLLTILNNRFGWRLELADIAEIWEKTLEAIWGNVLRGRFKRTGDLNAYVKKIARRRAKDFAGRRRISINRDVDVQTVADRRHDERHETSAPKFKKMIFANAKKLSKTERLVIGHLVRLLMATNRMPSSAEVLTSINGDGSKQLTLEAVKSARARAFRKLRGEGERK